MKLATFRLRNEGIGAERLGVVVDGSVHETDRKTTMEEFVSGYWDSARSPRRGRESHQLSEVTLCAPIRRPGKIVAAIVNTQGMLGGDVRLDRPRLDMKAPSTVIGPGEEIRADHSGIRPEVELAAVVGGRMTRVSAHEAKERIAGYTILNDVTAPRDSKDDAYEAFRRDPASGQITRRLLRGPLFRSKNHDTFCPTGPWIVTSDELKDCRDLKMWTRFGEVQVQSGSTSEYLFAPEEIASYVSQFLTLDPGDIVSCGSVGWSMEALGDLDPTEFVLPLRRGVLELGVERIGTLANPVVMGGPGES